MKPTPEQRRRYPHFVRPKPGHFHAVEFGTVYRSNGALHGMPTGYMLGIPEEYATARIENVIKRDGHEMHVHHDGTIVDIMGKQGAHVRKDKSELWEDE